jgi:hypothetical protein
MPDANDVFTAIAILGFVALLLWLGRRNRGNCPRCDGLGVRMGVDGCGHCGGSGNATLSGGGGSGGSDAAVSKIPGLLHHGAHIVQLQPGFGIPEPGYRWIFNSDMRIVTATKRVGDVLHIYTEKPGRVYTQVGEPTMLQRRGLVEAAVIRAYAATVSSQEPPRTAYIRDAVRSAVQEELQKLHTDGHIGAFVIQCVDHPYLRAVVDYVEPGINPNARRHRFTYPKPIHFREQLCRKPVGSGLCLRSAGHPGECI